MNIKEKNISIKSAVHNELKFRLTRKTKISKLVYLIDHMWDVK